MEEETYDYESFLRKWFYAKMGILSSTYNHNNQDYDQRVMQLAEHALDIVAYRVCGCGRKFNALFQTCGSICFITGKIINVVIPIVDGEMAHAFKESLVHENMTKEEVLDVIKEQRDIMLKNKKIMVYIVDFDTQGVNPNYEGYIIDGYGQTTYKVSIDYENSENN